MGGMIVEGEGSLHWYLSVDLTNYSVRYSFFSVFISKSENTFKMPGWRKQTEVATLATNTCTLNHERKTDRELENGVRASH